MRLRRPLIGEGGTTPLLPAPHSYEAPFVHIPPENHQEMPMRPASTPLNSQLSTFNFLHARPASENDQNSAGGGSIPFLSAPLS